VDCSKGFACIVEAAEAATEAAVVMEAVGIFTF
jgi:hypothetical protein